MKNSPAHIEIILTDQGPRIVEIGARLGGYRDRMYRLVNGIDLLEAAADIAAGQQPMLTAQKNEQCAVFELFPERSGTFGGITNANRIKSLSSCTYFDIKVTLGTAVGKAAEGYRCCAVIVLHNADKAQFAKDINVVKRFGGVKLVS
jgi:hypothetical protein